MDKFQEGQHQIANALDNCKSDLDRALALRANERKKLK